MGWRREAREGEGDDVSTTEAWHAEVAIGREIAAEADRIEADNAAHPEWPRLTVEETWHGCNSALDDARSVGPGGEVLHPRANRRHYYLVRHAAWALVALRAEAREMAAKGGGT